MKYSELETLLKTVCPETYHLGAPDDVNRFVVWGETGYGGVSAGGRKILLSIKFSVYIYTQDEDDSLVDDIIEALENAEVCVSGPSPGYDDERMTLVSVLECEAV